MGARWLPASGFRDWILIVQSPPPPAMLVIDQGARERGQWAQPARHNQLTFLSFKNTILKTLGWRTLKEIM